MGNEDFKINSALNDIRKIMDDILPNYTKLVSVLNKSKGMQCNDRKTNYAAYYTCIFRKVFIRVLRQQILAHIGQKPIRMLLPIVRRI